MTTDLPDPHGCPHCGHLDIAIKWGETICGMCGAPRRHADPGCPVRNAVSNAIDAIVGPGSFHATDTAGVRIDAFVVDEFHDVRESIIAETARKELTK